MARYYNQFTGNTEEFDDNKPVINAITGKITYPSVQKPLTTVEKTHALMSSAPKTNTTSGPLKAPTIKPLSIPKKTSSLITDDMWDTLNRNRTLNENIQRQAQNMSYSPSDLLNLGRDLTTAEKQYARNLLDDYDLNRQFGGRNYMQTDPDMENLRRELHPISTKVNDFLKGANPLAWMGNAIDYAGNLGVKAAQEVTDFVGADRASEALSQFDPTMQSVATQLFNEQRQQSQEGFKYGLGTVGQVASDVAFSGADMASKLALSAITGIPFLGLSAADVGAQQGQKALNEGYSAWKSAALALGSGAINAGIESFGGIAGNWGSKLLNALSRSGAGSAILQRLPQTAIDYIARAANSAGGQIARSALSEGMEEFTENGAQLFLENLLLNKDTPFDVKEALYQAGVGAITGGIFGGGNVALNALSNRAQSQFNPNSEEMRRAMAQEFSLSSPNRETFEPQTPDLLRDFELSQGNPDLLRDLEINNTSRNSIDEWKSKTFMQQVNDVMHGINESYPLTVGKTPQILQNFGASNRKMTMNPSTIRKIAYPEGYMGGKHNLGFYALEHLQEQLENPVAILKSSSQPNSFVIFTEFLDADGKPVMVPIHLDKNGILGISNEVASMYGRKNFSDFIQKQRELGNILYEDQKRTLQQLPVEGLQLPKMEDTSDPIYSIPPNDQNVNARKNLLDDLMLNKEKRDLLDDVMLRRDDGSFTNIRGADQGIGEEFRLGGESISAKPGRKRNRAKNITLEDAEKMVSDYDQFKRQGEDIAREAGDPDATVTPESIQRGNTPTISPETYHPNDISMTKSYNRLLDEAGRIKSTGVSDYFKDISRNLDAAAGNDLELRRLFNEVIERPLNQAKAGYSQDVESRLDELYQKAKGWGIRAGSKESAAIQWIGEGVKPDRDGNLQEYTLEMLQKEFPKKWETIVEAERYFRELYDSYIDKVNTANRMIYPGIEEQAEEQLTRMEAMITALQETIIPQRTQDVELMLDPLSKAQAMDDLSRAQRTLQLLQGQWSKMRSEVDDGTYFVGRRLLPRKDYFHHFQEMEDGFGGLRNILKTPAEIDPELVGVSDFTQPKSRWASFLQRREGGKYQADAIGGMVKYIPMAEYRSHIDPFVAYSRGIIRDLQDATRESRNANGLIEFLTDWTNDLAGKTNPIDRAIQKGVGRKTMKVVQWLNNRAKANAVVGNLGSAISQFYNLPNGIAYLKNPKNIAKGIAQAAEAAAGVKSVRELLDSSPFLRERFLDRSSRQFKRSIPQLLERCAGRLLEFGDEQVANAIWLGAYDQAVDRGVKDAVEYADNLTRRAIAGRGIGEMPLAQRSRLINLVAPFQTEVLNSFNVLKEKVRAKDLIAIAELFASTWLLNLLNEELTGRNTGLDPIGAALEGSEDYERDLEAFQSNNENEGEEFNRSRLGYMGGRIAGEFLSNMPYASQIVPSVVSEDASELLFGGRDPTRYGTQNMGVAPLVELGVGAVGNALFGKDTELGPLAADVAATYLTPYGGNQVLRTVEAAQDFGLIPRFDSFSNGVEGMPASYSSGGGYRFSPDASDPWNLARGLIFGSYATDEGKEYLESASYPLSEKRTGQLQKAYRSGISPEKFVDIVESLKGLEGYYDQNGDYVSISDQQGERILNDWTLTEPQKDLLSDFFINDILIIPQDIDRDYSSSDNYRFSLLSKSAQETYEEKIRELGISKGEFADYEEILSGVKSSKNARGNIISGSLKRNRIDALVSAGVPRQEAIRYVNARY